VTIDLIGKNQRSLSLDVQCLIVVSRDIDQKTGYKTKTLLCMPIMIQGSVIGVVQMVNKTNGHFTKSDEESFETFAVYCGLGKDH
jgi:cAMP and cAMP-inhibited cGMP 3',5'-cyclic phosphodiesterase 10